MSSTTPSKRAAERIATFRELHRSGCFVSPNPWDLGSARLLAQMGFKALATTSSGFAWSVGRSDNHVTLDQALEHCRTMAEAVELPVSADFEGGFAVEPAQVAVNVARAAETGIAGLSVEDSTGDPARPLHDYDLAVERICAARRALTAAGSGVLLTARTEGFIVGRPDLRETIRRLTAFAEAGADALFAPGIRTDDEITAVVRAVAPKPVNLLVGSGFITLGRAEALGVRRISVGGALARVAWGAVLGAAEEIAARGTFSGLDAAIPFARINDAFAPPDRRPA